MDRKQASWLRNIRTWTGISQQLQEIEACFLKSLGNLEQNNSIHLRTLLYTIMTVYICIMQIILNTQTHTHPIWVRQTKKKIILHVKCGNQFTSIAKFGRGLDHDHCSLKHVVAIFVGWWLMPPCTELKRKCIIVCALSMHCQQVRYKRNIIRTFVQIYFGFFPFHETMKIMKIIFA